MFYLLLLSISIFVFLGFLALTLVEVRTGTRILGGARSKLDIQVARATYVMNHVRWSEFLSHLVQSIAARIVHDVAHASLFIVRFAERQLTRVVRYLRTRRPNVLAPPNSRASPLHQTSTYLKKTMHVRPKEEKEKKDKNTK
ncbi:hypothetical protein H0X32_04000 [Patescibacteria group bacterium]|nr:hypothetical protein [Patescibacteria group bacterium]